MITSLCWWRVTACVDKDWTTLVVSVCQFTPSELMPGISLQTTVTWSCRVHALRGSDHAVSIHQQQLCGTISRLNWSTMTLAEHCSSLALRQSFLSMSTRSRRLWEHCLRHALPTDTSIDYMLTQMQLNMFKNTHPTV